MKKSKILFLLGFFICLTEIFAAELNYQNYELDTLLHTIEKPTKPVITDDYIIFTADTNNRFVGIAFDFENYQIIHPFRVMTRKDEEGKISKSYLFYCYEIQHNISQIKYRLVFDGLWATDPLNPNKEYDDDMNLYFSKIENVGKIEFATNKSKDDIVHFVYKGKSGEKVRLSGTFTNWDPWIYELKETSPGFYELDLPLTTGTYYYNYIIGMTSYLDSSNPQKAYTKDGRSASVIKVN